MRCILIFLMSVFPVVCFGQKAIPWGDQGNGTYKNPVLNAHYPDIDIEKQGDTYYMISSTNTMSPGMTILQSQDLVNWTMITHIVDTLWWRAEYQSDHMEGPGGVWAGDLAYHNGKWYCYFIDKWSGLYVYTADKIEGPWSKGTCLMKREEWTDPAVYFDDENQQAYMLCHYNTYRRKEDNEVMMESRIFKLSWDGMQVLDTGKVYYTGSYAEAVKAHKINGYYYLFMAEWVNAPHTGRDRKQFVLRSKDLYGPYEKKYLLEKRTKDDRSACQGSLVQSPDGRWWYMHQMVQNKTSFEGRPQHLIPVTWENDWPVFGQDTDGNGIGNTVMQWDMPVKGFPIQKPQTSDEFNAKTLAPQWNFFYNNKPAKWSLTEKPGHLRLKATVPLQKEDIHKVPNVIGQRKMGTGTDTVTVKIDLSGMQPLQQAGLIHKANYYFAVGVEMNSSKQKELVVNLEGKKTKITTVKPKIVYLRTVGKESRFHFEYSFDNKTYLKAGEPFQLRGAGHDADRIGLFSFSPTGQGYVDVDWFRYE